MEVRVDSTLIERAKSGDKEAFTMLALEMADRLYAMAARVLRDRFAAEDAVQEALLGAWRDLPKLRDNGRLEGWLYRILMNRCSKHLSARKRLKTGSGLDPEDSSRVDPWADDPQASYAHRDELERGFDRLSIDHRAVLVLTYYVGLSGAEIADLLGISPGTVRSRLHYGRDAMRAVLEADARPLPRGSAS